MLSAAVRQVAAHETDIATLTVRMDEMRDHLDQAGVRLHAAETQLKAGMNAGGYVRFTLGKEMHARQLQRYKSCEVLRLGVQDVELFLSIGDYEHAGDILEWITQQQDDLPEDRFDAITLQRGWVRQARDLTRFARYLFTVLGNRTDETPHRLLRNGRHKDGVNAWRRLRQ